MPRVSQSSAWSADKSHEREDVRKKQGSSVERFYRGNTGLVLLQRVPFYRNCDLCFPPPDHGKRPDVR
jgi:hypothetical protein